MAHKKLKKIVSMLVAISMVSSFSLVGVNADEVNDNAKNIDIEYVNERLTANYTLTSLNYSSSEYTGEKLSCTIDENGLNAAADKMDYDGSAYDINYGASVKATVNAPETALYRISVDYMSIDNSILPIEIGVKLNGDYPFYEARSMKLKTTWLAETESSYDRYGNQIVPLPDKKAAWQNGFLEDASYRYSEALLFEMQKGENTFDINVIEGNFILGNIYLEPVTHIADYNGSQKADGSELIRIQGENFAYRNDAAIHAAGEIDTKVYPFSVKETVLNTLDSTSFKTAGQSVTYEFEAQSDGYYYIGTNYKQSDKNGFPVFIDWAVDGEIPNKSFRRYPMEYTTKHKRTTLEDTNGSKLSVYLEKGTHEISMIINADYLRESLESVWSSII